MFIKRTNDKGFFDDILKRWKSRFIMAEMSEMHIVITD